MAMQMVGSQLSQDQNHDHGAMVFCQNQAQNRCLILRHHRAYYKLSKTHKINGIGQTELKLWN